MKMFKAIIGGLTACYILANGTDDMNLFMYNYAMEHGHSMRTLLRNINYEDITDTCKDCIGDQSKFKSKYGASYEMTGTVKDILEGGLQL